MSASLVRVEKCLAHVHVALPFNHRVALHDDLQALREEGFPTIEQAFSELLRRIGGKRNLVRFTNTLVPQAERLERAA